MKLYQFVWSDHHFVVVARTQKMAVKLAMSWIQGFIAGKQAAGLDLKWHEITVKSVLKEWLNGKGFLGVYSVENPAAIEYPTTWLLGSHHE
jgi:hypothetical protein